MPVEDDIAQAYLKQYKNFDTIDLKPMTESAYNDFKTNNAEMIFNDIIDNNVIT